MSRQTIATAEALLQQLNQTLDLPPEPRFLDETTGRVGWCVGNIHLNSANGRHSIAQVRSVAGGVKDLSPVLSTSDACAWLRAALEGVQLARTRCGCG